MFNCGSKEIYLICGATDMRKKLRGLATIASMRVACDSFEPAVLIFRNRSRKCAKIIGWDGDGEAVHAHIRMQGYATRRSIGCPLRGSL